jgi:hypothetical protein
LKPTVLACLLRHHSTQSNKQTNKQTNIKLKQVQSSTSLILSIPPTLQPHIPCLPKFHIVPPWFPRVSYFFFPLLLPFLTPRHADKAAHTPVQASACYLFWPLDPIVHINKITSFPTSKSRSIDPLLSGPLDAPRLVVPCISHVLALWVGGRGDEMKGFTAGRVRKSTRMYARYVCLDGKSKERKERV